MRKSLIALAAGTAIVFAPMFIEKAEAQRFGRGGGIGRVGFGGGMGRVGFGRGIGRVGFGRGIGRVGFGRGIGRVGFGRGIGRVGFGRRIGRVGFGGYPGWRVRRAAWWGAPLAVGIGVGALAYGSCYQWDPYYGWVNVCYTPYYGGYYGYW
jgi:hypothetical protein